ncbi:MAG: hypothetical protein ABSE17_02685 [Candidatus Levyibacteriota bacterium]|jgi:hypothetical protein
MTTEIIDFDKKRAERESERPKLVRGALRAVREHIRRDRPDYFDFGCIHNPNEQWVLVLTYRPRRRSTVAKATLSIYYYDARSEQDLRVIITNKSQTKRGRFAPTVAGMPSILFSRGHQEEDPSIVAAREKEVTAPPPEVTRQDLLQVIQLANNPLDLKVLAKFSLPEDWAGGKFPLGA